MLAEIITIGDEILIGQIVDTNSAWMAQKLNEEGIRVKQISSISDDKQHILKALAEAAQRADIILVTGGLGPTKDDITKLTIAEYFGVGLVLNNEALQNVENIFKKYNRPLLEVNRKQAEVPQNCEIILNNNGTAPGMWFNVDGKIYVSMPGVPFEMKYMMEEAVIPRLKQTLKLPVIIHKTILTVGEGESFLAEKIADIENDLPSNIKLAYLPKMGQVRLRLSAYGDGEASLQNNLEEFTARIVERVGINVVAQEDIPLEKVILNYMAERGLTLSVAESCTGGYVSHLITQHEGSSQVFLGGAVTYSNGLKENILGVKNETLYQFGAVSEQTVTEMAEGALRRFKSDFSVAITGIAGPGGGSDDKPLGTVWIAAAKTGKTVVKKFTFGNKRAQNIERSAVAAFFMLITLLKEN
ncbi:MULTISPECIES: competence/damage-inducible protein A [unclassified Mucilaginibacter]|uniref:competence/damage-inducible protein A n=1 Tax=unclassified Mucilaginibacter TaxID=2617802 RepID=UPI002AC96DDF|nr:MULTISPECIES: competence/damage-inducible protein A [unclassified Mucilaginibacter]MEB0261843.1 competence/damage-inducible protein A [Mucilaginibacter sp. 10I4]MEB0278936.1 competence/damage-inducible protein A [Mucilaginibacter sp. 10B2]MEB0302513.1 competence/damage-inducible protein A [Mucilaginibacter sp. 5C4]WPX22117.1 competence/damage-inducible protein A [Mucilaginibacter sp. 5C4]